MSIKFDRTDVIPDLAAESRDLLATFGVTDAALLDVISDQRALQSGGKTGL